MRIISSIIIVLTLMVTAAPGGEPVKHRKDRKLPAVSDDRTPTYRYPTTFNNVTSTHNHPPYEPAPLLLDEEFYGKWDQAKSTWKIPGLLDYNSRAGLKAVEACVKRGDYKAAGEALVLYYRNRQEIEPPELPEANDHAKLLAELFMDQVYLVAALSQFEVTEKPEEFVFDVTKEVQAGHGRFMLVSRNKGAATALFNSREAADHQPKLILTLKGKQQTLAAAADTCLQFNAKARGKEATLYVRGPQPGTIVDDNTKRALLRFDLNRLDVKTVEKAELVLYGRTDATSGTMGVLLRQDIDSALEAANESTLVWKDVNHTFLSMQGIEGLQAWRNPKKGNCHTWFFAIFTRFPHYPHIIAMYRKTGDERYAQQAIQIYLNYVEFQLFNRLDSGIRVGNLIAPSMVLYKSPSMTPQALKIMIEHAWRLGNWFNTTKEWFPDKNYGPSQLAGACGISYQFPELRNTPRWWQHHHQRFKAYITRQYYPDCSLFEANTGYGPMVLEFLDRYRDFALKSNVELPESSVKRYLGITRYCMDVTDPSGWIFPYGDTTPKQYSTDLIRRIAEAHDDQELLFISTDGKRGKRPVRSSTYYPDGKLAIMRTAWADKNALSLFVNARNGGRHWNPNTLSLCAYGYGRQLIDDTYYASSDWSDTRTKWTHGNTKAHNTIEIDGITQARKAPADGSMIINNQFDLFEGYTDATAGFRHSRRILLVKPSKFWIVSDLVEAKATPEAQHRYTQAWHPRPDSHVSIADASKTAATAYPTGGNIRIVPADPEKLTAELADGWWFTDENKYVTYKRSCKGSTTFDTVLYPMPEGETANVQVKRIDTGVATTTTTALAVRIADKNSVRNGWYYLSHEKTPPKRTIAHLTSDARMVYLEENDKEQLLTLSLEKGKVIRDEKRKCILVQADAAIADLGVQWEHVDKTIRISTASGSLPNTVKIIAPFATGKVTLNGNAVAFDQQAGVIVLK